MTRRDFLLASALTPLAVRADEYIHGPDSTRQEGIPRGDVRQFPWTSKIYPGSTRNVWAYTPAKRDLQKPLCLAVFQDGGGFLNESGDWRVPVVLDNLIARGQLPPMAALFVDPGVLPPATPALQARFNRSFEYDDLTDRYASFLIDELIPELRKTVPISDDPNDRCIGGASSGGIAAFLVAWHRPDAFRRVISAIGSYVNLRGGEVLPSLVRKSEALPLRIFLQDGTHDMNMFAGSWYLANQDMASALEYAGYDCKFEVGVEGHNGKHGGAILPEIFRWLWRDYPHPLAVGMNDKADRRFVDQILQPDAGWEIAKADEMPATKSERSLPPGRSDAVTSRVSAPSADGGQFFSGERNSLTVWCYQVAADGSLQNAEPFIHLEPKLGTEEAGVTAMAADDQGFLWVATAAGIQVCDQPGRVTAIVRSPSREPLTGLAFGGPDAKTLYVRTATQTYRRRVRRAGALAGHPVKPPVPQL